MVITTTMMMMVMDQFEDLGVVLCRPSRLISKVIAYGEHGSKLRPAQSTRWNIIATSCTMNFSFPQVLPILVMYPPPPPPCFPLENTAIFVHSICEAHLYTYITPV